MLLLLAAASAHGAKTQIKVMSFNVLAASYKPGEDAAMGDKSWGARKGPIFKMLREEMPDVMGLNEPRLNQVRFLVDSLPGYSHLEQAVRDPLEESMHNMIMYRTDRFDLIDSGLFWLSDTPEVRSKGWDGTQNRCALWVCLREKESGKEFYFVCTHLSLGGVARQRGANLIVERMKKIAGKKAPVFVVGDMNASFYEKDTRRDQLRPFYYWMQSAREKALDTDLTSLTYNRLGESKPALTWNIDHIFYRNVIPLEYKVLNEPIYGVPYISDHWPITLVCEF